MRLNYREWIASVPPEITGDSLWKMEAYRLALFASDVAWIDVTKLISDLRTRSLADQLYREADEYTISLADVNLTETCSATNEVPF